MSCLANRRCTRSEYCVLGQDIFTFRKEVLNGCHWIVETTSRAWKKIEFQLAIGTSSSHTMLVLGKSREFIKVSPQKLKLLMNFFEPFLVCSLPSTVLKNTIKMIGHHAPLRDVTGQSYPIYARTCANRACYSSVQVTVAGSIVYWRNT